MRDTSKELIAAIYSFSSTASNDTSELQLKKNELSNDLQKYVNNADRIDYAVAIGSGIICGLLDSLFVGEFTVNKKDMILSNETVNRLIHNTAEITGGASKRLNEAIGHLEKMFPMAQDNVWKGANIGVSAKNHHLADFAHHPTMLGLVSSIIVQFLRVGFFVNQNGEIHVLNVPTTSKEIIETWGPIVIAGISNWIVAIAEKRYDQSNDYDMPQSIKTIVRLVACTPAMIDVLKVAQNWAGHLVSDLAGSKQTAGGGMGIPGVFLSLAYEIASLPGLRDTGLPKQINDLYVKYKQDFRHELPTLKIIGKQTLVVILNDTIVRLFYFIRRLATQIRDKGINSIDWNQVIPFDNKTILRMTTISSASFVAVDLTDAAIRGAIESEGNWAIFAARLASRVNIVGAGKIAISVVAEVKMANDELKALRERRYITEELASRNISALVDYRAKIQSLVEQYLADDLEAFLLGLTNIKSGLEERNADAVIEGSVIIQKKLGRDIQFSNLDEFNNFMQSSDAFML